MSRKLHRDPTRGTLSAMRAGVLVLLLAACGPRVANSPRIVEDDLDMPPPGAMTDTELAVSADPTPAAGPAPPPSPTASAASPAANSPAPGTTGPARPVAAWPPTLRAAVAAVDELPDARRVIAPPGKGPRTGTIARDRLLVILDAGPGNFLRQLEVAPRLSGDRFVGWQLVQLLDPGGPLHGVDLVSGDILLTINGNPLSRPEHLQAMWDSLRIANEVTAHLWRSDKKFDLHFKIEPRVP